MTHTDFIKAIEGYYGEYPREDMKKMVLQYLTQYFEPDKLTTLYAEVLKTFTAQYRAVPDIAVFEGILQGWKPTEKRAIDYKVGGYIPERTASDDEADEAFKAFWDKIEVSKWRNDE